MHTPDKAWQTILDHTSPLAPAPRALAAALNHVLAEPIRADRDLPPANRSAMDGYAVRAADLRQCPVVLRLVGEVAAGSAARPPVRPGTCVRVLTGGNVPPGADSVVIQEEAEEANGQVRILAPTARGANMHRRGEQARRGAILIRKGALLDAARTGVAAAVGQTLPQVHRRPRVTVLCTGAELRAPGQRVRPHQLRNSNGPALCAALAPWHDGPVTYRSLPDNAIAIATALKRAARNHDVILVTGGMSVGKYDLAREAIERAGAVVRLHGGAIKPGKPFLYATLGEDRHIFGMPGNPLGALTGLHEFVLPALRRLSGVHPRECRPALWLPLGAALSTKGGRVHCMLARLRLTARGPDVLPVAARSSADFVAAGRADGVVIVPPGVRIGRGALVEFRPWRPLP